MGLVPMKVAFWGSSQPCAWRAGHGIQSTWTQEDTLGLVWTEGPTFGVF